MYSFGAVLELSGVMGSILPAQWTIHTGDVLFSLSPSKMPGALESVHLCTEPSATSIIQERFQKSKMFNCWTLLSLICRADIVLINTPKQAQMHTGFVVSQRRNRF